MSHVADVPLTLFRNKIFVSVSMNGAMQKLAVDTGSDMTVLSTAAARSLDLPRDFDHTAEALGVGGVDNHLYTAQVDRMELGGLTFSNWHLPIADFSTWLADGEEMGGLLGGDILSQFDIDLDIPGRTIGFWRVTDCTTVAPPWTAASSSVPLIRAGHHLIAVPITVDNAPVQLELDTGAPDLVLSERDAARAGASPESIEDGPAVSGRGVNNGGYTGHVHVFGLVSLGGARYEEVPTLVVPRSRFRASEGLFGLRFLIQHRVWISYATNTLFVQTAPAP